MQLEPMFLKGENMIRKKALKKCIVKGEKKKSIFDDLNEDEFNINIKKLEEDLRQASCCNDDLGEEDVE
jgi:hypothetical protein